MSAPKKGVMKQILVPLVDATDFASIESGITESDFNSGATLLMYGVNNGVSSLASLITISKTGRLVRSGVFQITVKGTENTHDHHTLRISKTGCAEQIYQWDNEDYTHSDLMSRLSDVGSDLRSYLVGMSGMLSDAHSAAILAASNASEAQSHATLAASRVLVVQSRLSDFDSRLVSDVSDIRSMLTALSDAISDAHSDLGSKIGAITASVSASDISDIASAVWAHTVGTRVDSRVLVIQSAASDAASAATQGNSRVLLVQSRLSDFNSAYVSDISDIRSMLTALSDAVSDAHSDLASKIGGVTATVSASDMSDIASRVRVLLDSDLSDLLSRTTQINSRIIVMSGVLSDVYSLVSNINSATLVAADVSDFASAVAVELASDLSDLLSRTTQINSRVLVAQSAASDAHSAALIIQSRLSDFNSVYTSDISDLRSYLSDIHSDLKSAIGNVSVALTASDISDIASAVAAAVTTITTSDISDIASRVDAVLASRLSDILSAAQQANSRVALLSDFESNFSSRVPKRVATDSQLSALVSDVLSALAAGVPVSASDMSDIRSAITAGTLTASTISDIASAVAVEIGSRLSDILSAAQQTNSRVLVTQSHASDIYSLLSDLHSDVGVLSGVVSDIDSLMEAGVEIGASSLSDLRSAITANGVLRAGIEPTAVVGHTDALATKVDWLTALSRNKITQTATLQSLRNDADNSTIASAAVSDDNTTFVRGEFGS